MRSRLLMQLPTEDSGREHTAQEERCTYWNCHRRFVHKRQPESTSHPTDTPICESRHHSVNETITPPKPSMTRSEPKMIGEGTSRCLAQMKKPMPAATMTVT